MILGMPIPGGLHGNVGLDVQLEALSMRRALCGAVVLLLALPALRAADDKPAETKSQKTPKQQYDALLKEFVAEQQKYLGEYRKTKGAEQQKILQKYMAVGQGFADRVFKIAEDNPKDPVATDALFWVVQNGGTAPARAKALEKVSALLAEMPLADLNRKLATIRGGNRDILEVVYKRAEKDAKEPQAADLLAWVARSGYYLPIGQKATKDLVEKYPDHGAIEQICQMLGYGNNPASQDLLRQILEKNSKSGVQAAAALALGKTLSGQADRAGNDQAKADKLAAEAEKYLLVALDKLGSSDAVRKKAVQQELKALRTLRVGKVAPEIEAGDLDEKKFKLSDYRGKVVLLDFWGNW